LVDTNNLTGYAQVVEELVSGQVTKQYTYGLDLISQRQSSGVSFYNYDGHGSVRGLSNVSGSVTDTYSYDTFGTLIERTGNTDNNYLYAGEQFDSDLGFYYNRARYLKANAGRFISQDTFEGNSSDPTSLHKYAYASNNGVNKIDPSGNEWSLPGLITFGVVIGILATIAVPPSLNSLLRGTFGGAGNAPQINIETQPIIVEGSDWDEGIANATLSEAADFWLRWAHIKINILPTIRLSGLPTSVVDTKDKYGLTQSVLASKLAERGLTPKHTSIFLNSITTPAGGGALGETVPLGEKPQQTLFGTSALAYQNFSRLFLNYPASQTVAHEWGHSFGLEHTSSPGLMASQPFSDIPNRLDSTYYQNIISGDQIETARSGAERYR
jgi:RHS repeat-associated protein